MLIFSKYFSIDFLIDKILYELPFYVFINIGNDKGPVKSRNTMTTIVIIYYANALENSLKSPVYRAEDGLVIKCLPEELNLVLHPCIW